MTSFTARISAAATLALAALPMAALPASALAAPSVRISDINLLTDQGMATFQDRAQVAASDYCARVVGVSARATCLEGAKAELDEKVTAIRTVKLEQSSSTLAAR